ncbi:MAG: site-specific integrase [Candidatus Thiodiazotropha taylori]|nr:site-specific integrase [Candidatus Thiodiazotropha taylori]MCG7971495.1 site-specific integrase [Candidatus Thiodiazotropha taylori]
MTEASTTDSLQRYLHAATRENTRQSYRAAVEHFEVTWGGFLPATADQVARYLADHAETHTVNTLRQRLAALARWHQDQGFPDPTKAPLVKKVIKGIAEEHPYQERQAKPLQLEQLQTVVIWLERRFSQAQQNNQRAQVLQVLRNRAMLLMGFWRGFRSDELCRLRIEHIETVPGEGMTLFLPRSKADRQNRGQSYPVPALSQLCPVTAYLDWINAAGLSTGPVFRSISRWGQIGETPIHPDSLNAILKTLWKDAGLSEADRYSSHSLRRGFAQWASGHRWDLKTLMDYVGWRDPKSALRYLDSAFQDTQSRIQQDLATALPATVQSASMEILVDFRLEPFHKRVRSVKKIREHLVRHCLKRFNAHALEGSPGRYRLEVEHRDADHLNEIMDDLLQELHTMANDRECFIEVSLRNPQTQRIWD